MECNICFDSFTTERVPSIPDCCGRSFFHLCCEKLEAMLKGNELGRACPFCKSPIETNLTKAQIGASEYFILDV